MAEPRCVRFQHTDAPSAERHMALRGQTFVAGQGAFYSVPPDSVHDGCVNSWHTGCGHPTNASWRLAISPDPNCGLLSISHSDPERQPWRAVFAHRRARWGHRATGCSRGLVKRRRRAGIAGYRGGDWNCGGHRRWRELRPASRAVRSPASRRCTQLSTRPHR
jgi:hypothetical protein